MGNMGSVSDQTYGPIEWVRGKQIGVRSCMLYEDVTYFTSTSSLVLRGEIVPLALHSCLVYPLRVYDVYLLLTQHCLCVGTHPTLVYAADMPQQHDVTP